jgi:hypothetical protein
MSVKNQRKIEQLLIATLSSDSPSVVSFPCLWPVRDILKSMKLQSSQNTA